MAHDQLPEDQNPDLMHEPTHDSEPIGTGDLLTLMARGFQAENATLQSSVPEAGAPEHSGSEEAPLPNERPQADSDEEIRRRKRGIVSINGEDVDEIHVDHRDEERAA